MPQQDEGDDLTSYMNSMGGGDEAPASDHLPAVSAPATEVSLDDDGDDPDTFMKAVVVTAPKDRGLSKPWMKFHRFNLVKTVDEVRDIVDRALEHGRCGLDLETEGLDNRIRYDDQGKPYTIHKIVGFCLSVKGVGYYVPVRHNFQPGDSERDPNVPLAGVEAEITRLCKASQPILTPEGMEEDPLASTKMETPPRVVISFWYAKFDQEFLYPVTGIEIWHPESFQDGHTAAYAVYSDDSLGLKDKAKERLAIFDPDNVVDGKPARCPYEMIRFEDLFPSTTKSADRRFQDLYPEEGNAVVLYACSDAICTEILCDTKEGHWEHTRDGLQTDYRNVVSAALSNRHSFTYRLENQTTQAVRDMERQLAKIDREEILRLLEKAEIELAKYRDLIVGLAQKKGIEEFNPGSPQQLSDFLFGEKGLDIKPKPLTNANGFFKTDAATLEAMAEAHDAPAVLGWIVKYRQVDKIRGTYLKSMSENCDEHDQLRFKFNQTGAATGRFTAPAGEADHGYAGIPIQGIPARDDPKKPEVAQALRRIFIAREGYTLVKVDYAGQELRIVANLSGEPVWIEEFLHGTGDLHTITAKAFFGPHITKENKVERNAGKIANFSLIYGGGAQAIMRATKCDKVEAARRKSNFDKSVPTFAGWVSGQKATVKKQKGVWTAFKRFIAIPDANVKAGDVDSKGSTILPEDARKIQAACERKATNFPIQGSGADIMKISLVKLMKEFHKRGWRRNGGDDSVRMIMTVHDEIVFEIKHERLAEAVPVIITIMESPSRIVGWKVPLVVEPLLGKSWEAKHDWEKIQHGKEPVPDWLQGILVPGKAFEKPPEGPKPSAPPPPVVETNTARPEAEPFAVESGKGILRVANFALSNTFLTSRSVDLVFEAVAGCLDPDRQVFLRLIDNGGNILLDPSQHRIPVLPEKLKMKFMDRNLGSGEFELKEEPI